MKKLLIILLLFFGKNIQVKALENNITYQSHIQSIGWQEVKNEGKLSGTTGESKRLEAIKININNENGNIEYKSYIEENGWEESYKKNGEISGTTGKAKKLEAIKIRLTGQISEEYNIYYRVHVQILGWLNWVKNDEIAGTLNHQYRIEGIEIKLTNKSDELPNNMQNNHENNITYQSHIQSIGWQEVKNEDELSGTTGESKRLEAIKININNENGNIEYKSYIEENGWEESYKKNGEISGTTGKAKRLEAIKIKITGEITNQYDIYYRVHTQKFGWLGWAKNDEIAGTIGYNLRIEAIEVKLIGKNDEVINNIPSYYEKNIIYQSHISKIGWEDYKSDGDTAGKINEINAIEAIKIKIANRNYEGNVKYKTWIEGFGWENNIKKNGETSGSTGKYKSINAILIKLDGDIANQYDIYYRVSVQKLGWLDWTKNGAYAGTNNETYKINGINIKLIKKEDEAPPTGENAYIMSQNSYYILSNKENEKVIENKNNNIKLSSNKEKISQIWKIQKIKDNYLIKPSSNPNHCLNNDIKINKCDYSDTQLWKLNNQGEGYYSISSNNNKYLTFNEQLEIILSDALNNKGLFRITDYNKIKVYKGIDISKWQGNINWQLMSKEKPDFIIMRIGTGRNEHEKDSKFEEYYENATKQNIPIGIYMYSFAHNITEAKEEANLTIEWLNKKNIDLPIFYDIENISQTILGKEVLTAIAETYCETIMNNNYHCGIYANKYFLQDNLNAEILALKYPIWLAHYTGATTYQEILTNNFFNTDYSLTPFKYYQFTSLGQFQSITENTVDLDLGYDIFD